MRALLDGHIVLTRELAHQGHYPAIDVLVSISRLTMQLTRPNEREIIRRVLSLLNLYQQNKEMIELGAYQRGNNPALDAAVDRIDALLALLRQNTTDAMPVHTVFQRMQTVLE